MLIINANRLNFAEAIQDKSNPMYVFAKEFDDGIRELRKKYPEGHIKFLRVGYPRYSDTYVDAQGKEHRDVPEDIPPMRFSLTANVSDPKRGKESWGVCLGVPKPLAGGLWDIGTPRSKQITNGLSVDLTQDAELAFFLVHKSPHVRSGQWKIDDPKADMKDKGDEEREQLERKTAIWQTLQDEEQLRKVAAAYGVTVKNKEADAIRFDLEATLKTNDEMKKRDPSYKGTKEFMEDLKINDYVRLSAFIRHWLDESKITYSKDGRYKIGDKAVAHIPADQAVNKFAWLCNYFAAPNNKERLQDLMRDLVNKDYLDAITDDKDYRWLAGVMDIKGYYNKPPEDVKEMVYTEFSV